MKDLLNILADILNTDISEETKIEMTKGLIQLIFCNGVEAKDIETTMDNLRQGYCSLLLDILGEELGDNAEDFAHILFNLDNHLKITQKYETAIEADYDDYLDSLDEEEDEAMDYDDFIIQSGWDVMRGVVENIPDEELDLGMAYTVVALNKNWQSYNKNQATIGEPVDHDLNGLQTFLEIIGQ